MGHVGSFATSAKIREAQTSSLSFIQGVPVYERFFLGDEFTIRGYNVRSISPIVPIEQFVSSRNVVVASNAADTPIPIQGLQQFASLGAFTGTSGANSRFISRGFQPIGADTQLLGNFEYRVPIFGPVSVAGFADIGSAFNLRKGGDQVFSSTFQNDSPFLNTLGIIPCPISQFGGIAPATLTTLAACRDDSELALSGGFSLVARDNRLITREEFANAIRNGPMDPITGLPVGLQAVFLRGEAQTNTAVRLSQSVFDKISDFRSSVGVELRVQLPVVNVPLRLIGFYNPNARRGVSNEVPLFFREEKMGYRFSIGRTF
jgi:outer membrane protein insertion porin family